MLSDLACAEKLVLVTEDLLRRADVRGRLPTPVDDIVRAAGLVEPAESVLSESALRRAPAHLREAMAPLRGKVQALLDRREREVHLAPHVHLDSQRAFKRLHEVGHDILPWQQALAYADDAWTLSSNIRILREQEANQAAAELLFQRGLFGQMADDYRVSIAAVVELAQQFGASIHATFRRYVETHRVAMAGLVLDPAPVTGDPPAYRRRETMHSNAWARRHLLPEQWPRVLRATEFDFVASASWALSANVRETFPWPDVDGKRISLEVELFSNSYSTFVLLWEPRREALKRRRVLVA